MKRLILCVPLLWMAASAAAQPPATPPSGSVPTMEVDPIRCWWRTSADFVRTGETFDLALTCAVLQTETVQVIPDESRLGSAVIQMAPFEVVDGRRPTDLQSGSRRFFQYQYTIRIINPDAIGKDVKLPPMAIHYAINSQVAARTAVEGRDLVYLLPEQSIRVASMVPADTPDIRDAAGEDFANVESLAFKSRVLEIAGTTAVALGALMTAVVLVGYARRATRRTPADQRLLPIGRLASAAARELSAVASARSEQGWNEVLAGRALAATRIAASCAMGHVTNQRLAGDVATGEGRLVVAGALRGKPRSLSSPITAVDVSKAIERSPATDPERVQMLEGFRDAIAAFTTTQYGRAASIDQTSLDAALSGADAAAKRVKSQHGWLRTFLRQLRAGRPAEAQA